MIHATLRDLLSTDCFYDDKSKVWHPQITLGNILMPLVPQGYNGFKKLETVEDNLKQTSLSLQLGMASKNRGKQIF